MADRQALGRPVPPARRGGHGRPFQPTAAQPRLLVLDLDHFKRINDSHGHAAGDLALTEVARRLSRCVRDGDVLARYGGQEFAVVLPTADSEAALEVADRRRRSVSTAPSPCPAGSP